MAPPTEKDFRKKIYILESRRDAYYARMQRIYDSRPSISKVESCDLFLSQCETIDDIRKEFMATINDINSLNMELDPEFIPDFNSWSGFEDIYCAIRHTKNVLNRNVKQDEQPRSCYAKLPPIEIPDFNGNPAQWSLFYETFKSTVHSNMSLSKSEKLYYLLGRLKGPAQLVFSGISPTADNYECIWNALVTKYQDKRFLANVFLDNIFDSKALPNPATASQLETFIDKFAASVAALKQLNIVGLSDYIFIYLALKRLDRDTAKAFEMFVRDTDIPTYDQFIDFMKGQVKIIQRTNNTATSSKVVQKDVVKPKMVSPPKITHTYISATSHNNSDSVCSLCNANHEHIYNCKAFLDMSPANRHTFIMENKYCTNCLSSKHKWTACKSTSSCRNCGYRHHTLIHLSKTAYVNEDRKLSRTPLVKPQVDKPQQVSSTPQDAESPHHADRHATTSCMPVSLPQRPQPHNHVSSPAPAHSVDVPIAGSVSYLSADNPRANFNSQNPPLSTSVVLGTACVYVRDRYDNLVLCRCIIDPGSQNNFITASCCRKLGLNIEQLNRKTIIKGLGDHSSTARGKTHLTFHSRVNAEQSYSMDTLVLNTITEKLPTVPINISSCDYLKTIPLADDNFSSPSDIEILIGAKLFVDILLPDKIVGPPYCPSAFSTTLGYIVMGDAQVDTEPVSSVSYFATGESIHDDLEKFFKLEDLKDKPVLSHDDRECESFYQSTTLRDGSGRFTVGLPFKENPNLLGDSLKTARNRFLSLERKFQKNPHFKARYDEVIREYLDKGYLLEILEPKTNSEGFVLPHHGVLREDKSSSKLRIVLNASEKTSSGTSLNDILHTGPALQSDLFNILLNFRLFGTAVTADIRQMYLQILTREQDQPYQQIIYRFDPREPLRFFAFNRVCFGLRSSPFLAIRTIHELAHQERERFPLAATLAFRDLYIDDIASSFATTDEAVTAAQQLIDMFSAGCFEMVKWSSNARDVLSTVPESHRLTDPVDLDKDESLKILGMQWFPASDLFKFTITPSDRVCTKRNMLSTIARLWDILGLVGPVIVTAKILIKELCSLKLDWDDTPPDYIVHEI
ncbi:uncharacterized protein LOC126372693 [Pectinophora gossypiella]|uniref:uncharacterized protein LOC126372693 n=1 Tax=Pectinophora gossypiella TaxID=13191 RepID=UPI00214F1A61|nr:uncharacterized protein LOC126372693 [Pectinophora gossypiella]